MVQGKLFFRNSGQLAPIIMLAFCRDLTILVCLIRQILSKTEAIKL